MRPQARIAPESYDWRHAVRRGVFESCFSNRVPADKWKTPKILHLESLRGLLSAHLLQRATDQRQSRKDACCTSQPEAD